MLARIAHSRAAARIGRHRASGCGAEHLGEPPLRGGRVALRADRQLASRAALRQMQGALRGVAGGERFSGRADIAAGEPPYLHVHGGCGAALGRLRSGCGAATERS